MSALFNSLIGMTFLGVSVATTFLMFYLWKFPYDHETHKSSAPQILVKLHRVLGVIFVIIYVYLMWQMVPRLWSYQIELPARTVFHLTLGMSIGAILIIKLAIVRFFKHMEAKLVPGLGVALTICTMLLIFLALPFSLREAYLQNSALDSDDATTMERIERIRSQLPSAGITDPALIDSLATRESLDKGREVLMGKCSQCHDLRTVLARPRTPESWAQTISRMANRSTILNPITEQDQLEVAAYLIAISPTLQKSLMDKRSQTMTSKNKRESNMRMAKGMMENGDQDYQFDEAMAKKTFEQRCSQCHAFTQVERVSLAGEAEVIGLVERMVGNGLEVNDDELMQIIRYITLTYAQNDGSEGESEETSGSDDSEGATEEPSEANDEDNDENGEIESETDSDENSAVVSGIDGQALYEQGSCEGCHGPGGNAPLVPSYPKLAGQNKGYLVQQLKDFRDGSRSAGLAAVMQPNVASITDDEILAIATYLSGLEE